MRKRSNRRKPPRTQIRRVRKARPALSDAYWDVTHRPLQCLVFLLPLVILYEAGMAYFYRDGPVAMRPSLAAEELIFWFFSLFGGTGAYLPGAVLLVVLLGWHIAGHYPWKTNGQALAGMFGESVLLAIPLFLLHGQLASLHAVADGGAGFWSMRPPAAVQELLLSVGAGIYEELVFRLIFIGLLNLLLINICGMKQVAGVAATVVLSSLLFALHHYPPIGSDTWSASQFAFRAAAGAYLAAVYVLRGFGLAVGCHTMYDVFAFGAS
ncbi:MAG TPA: CPBP family glutamic-type intramembrane protease [Phycisphaerae bacterium]|nr:CPBP family glutamic-type intramembrane protease [Phycisphaerae bacterium]